MNMSDQPRSFRVNANLHGAYFHAAALRERASTSSTQRSSAARCCCESQDAGSLPAGCRREDPDRERVRRHLARPILPSEALLAFDKGTAIFPMNTPMTVPMQTQLLTLPPGGTVTVLFDVAVYAPTEGQVNSAHAVVGAVFLTDDDDAAVVDVLRFVDECLGGIRLRPGGGARQFLDPVGTPRAIDGYGANRRRIAVPDTDVTFTILSGPMPRLALGGQGRCQRSRPFRAMSARLLAPTRSGRASGHCNRAGLTNTWSPAPSIASITPENATIRLAPARPSRWRRSTPSPTPRRRDRQHGIHHRARWLLHRCYVRRPHAGPHTVTATYNGRTDDTVLTLRQWPVTRSPASSSRSTTCRW